MNGWLTYWDGWFDWNIWQGFPGDHAWLIAHCYGFSGEVRPIAFRGRTERVTLIKVCGVYLIHDYDADGGYYLYLPPGNTLEQVLYRSQYSYGAELWGCWSAMDEMSMFEDMNRMEHACARRNRWTELSARGGFPDLRLRSIFRPHNPPRDWLTPSLDSHIVLPIGNFEENNS